MLAWVAWAAHGMGGARTRGRGGVRPACHGRWGRLTAMAAHRSGAHRLCRLHVRVIEAWVLPARRGRVGGVGGQLRRATSEGMT